MFEIFSLCMNRLYIFVSSYVLSCRFPVDVSENYVSLIWYNNKATSFYKPSFSVFENRKVLSIKLLSCGDSNSNYVQLHTESTHWS